MQIRAPDSQLLNDKKQLPWPCIDSKDEGRPSAVQPQDAAPCAKPYRRPEPHPIACNQILRAKEVANALLPGQYTLRVLNLTQARHSFMLVDQDRRLYLTMASQKKGDPWSSSGGWDKLASQHGWGPRALRHDAQHLDADMMLFDLSGASALSPKQLRTSDTWEAVLMPLRQMHAVLAPITAQPTASLHELLQPQAGPSAQQAQTSFLDGACLAPGKPSLGMPPKATCSGPARKVLCHNQLSPAHIFLNNGAGKAMFVEWGACGWGDPLNDLAIFAASIELGQNNAADLLAAYLQQPPPNKLVAHFAALVASLQLAGVGRVAGSC